MIKQQDKDDYSIIDKIYLYVKDPHDAKYQYLTKNMKKWFWKFELSKKFY